VYVTYEHVHINACAHPLGLASTYEDMTFVLLNLAYFT
jgi:hypothetical protein